MDGFGAARPLLERPEGRAAKGEERSRAELARHSLDNPPAPAVERMVQAVGGLRLLSRMLSGSQFRQLLRTMRLA